ncbi:precorrin-6A reductase [Nocardioides flavus (ex Wang et al. 2016)]|uniref:Precorrin-6A reductase n=1 Tax=Nocardioides flavus (ex Wang et al. 2016) TaxID=2058780 RepID=A0ABQ3HDE5_9ACTN|nr:cobalt-precorrin-6A reductase [Nocardioides flavus (ex Wang et al. 2016)]GHE15178.1 precorrin-6A reductase [Nocardioides flavus (ex Wang et al. 2016)]
MTVLLLAGTGEARELATLLDEAGVEFVASLAGRVERPRLPVGEVRTGGFGGVEGLRAWLAEHGATAVVDATHPFSEGMSANAAAACAASGVPLLRLARPGWGGAPGAKGWHWVDDHAAAAALAASLGRRPLLTVGRQPLGHYTAPLAGHRAVVRVVDLPETEVPAPWLVMLDRGPYDLAGELELLAEHAVDVLVTRDSGGSRTWPKMAAAGQLGVPVVVVRRRAEVDGVQTVPDAAAALAWVVSSSVVS